MIVVSDTSPITYLHQIERFALLRSLYGEVVVPPAVERELREAAPIHEGLDWSALRVVEPKNSGMVTSLSASLDLGESEAIVVASEIQADLLLIDEANGREVARRMGFDSRVCWGCCWKPRIEDSSPAWPMSWTVSKRIRASASAPRSGQRCFAWLGNRDGTHLHRRAAFSRRISVRILCQFCANNP